jgi:xanthine dehydrogenase YagR molybdenum-binding subunit
MAKVIKVQTEFEGRFYEEYVVIEGEDVPPWEPDAQFKIVGKPQPRVDGPERVMGRAQFAHDVQLPGMLYGKILRCPHPHARIKRLDTSKAEKLPGVRLVLSHKNAPEIPWFRDQTRLFDTTLRYAGDEVACVIADDEEICEDALELIDVEYELLPYVVDPERALQPEAPKVHESLPNNLVGGEPDVYERGDLDRGFEEADVVVEGTLRTQTVLHNCMETHGSVAYWEDDTLVIWDSTQHIFGVRAQVARALGLPQHKVRVIKQYMGGGFGSKNQAGKYTVIAALAAQRTGCPVKLLLDRFEEHLATGNRPSTIQTLKIGAKRDGTLTAIYHKSILNAGAYAIWPPSAAGPTKRLYACPNVRTEDWAVFTNLGPFSAFRAPGYVEGTFALESMMDELAKQLDMDPIELRLRNYAEIDPITSKPYTTKGLRQAYERGAQLIGWEKREEVKRERSTRTKRVGFGMASQIWSGGGGPPAYALVKINPDGTATVITGTQDIGTGTRTALAQIAAEALGFPIEAVEVELGDTQWGVYSPLSAGSMTLASVGPAVRAAAEDARRQLLDVVSQVLEIPLEQLQLEDGELVDGRSGQHVPIREIFKELGNYMIVGKGARGPNPEDKNINTFGAQFAQVEVDLETGAVKVEKIVAVHESGRVINPLTIKSQLEGGIIMGLGYALIEQRFVDPRRGLVLSASLETYKVPTVADVPEIVAEMIDMPDPEANNLGVKGVGEPPIIPTAAAIANAVADALGFRIYELPLSPDRVLSALQDGCEESDGDPR